MNMLTHFPEHVQVVKRNKARRDRDDRGGYDFGGYDLGVFQV